MSMRVKGAARWRKNAMMINKSVGSSAEDLLKACHVVAMDDMAKTFISEGANLGSAWAPLAEATQNIRRQTGFPPSRPIHIRSGQLLNTMVNPKARGHKWKTTLNKRSASMTGRLSISHSPKRSAGTTHESVPNLMEELTTPTANPGRPARPLYDKNGQGISRNGVKEIEKVFRIWGPKMAKELEKAMSR